MKSLLFILFSCAIQAAVAAPVKAPATPAKPVAHFSSLNGLAALGASMKNLKEGMQGIKGLGENLAQGHGQDAAQVGDLGKILQNLDLIKPVAEMDFIQHAR